MAAKRTSLTAEYIRGRLHYDPDTGIFTWRERPGRNQWNSAHSGKRAGSAHNCGYWFIGIDLQYYLAGRIAWLYMTGAWPKNEIDHRNLNRADDRWENLREATHAQNSTNRRVRADNTSGHAGISWCARTKKWAAHVQVNGRPRHVGYFACLDEAVAARRAGEALHYGEFAYDPRQRMV